MQTNGSLPPRSIDESAHQVAFSTEIQIDKGVPLTGKNTRRGAYPFSRMDVGDSFALPIPPNMSREAFQSRLRAASHVYKPRKFALRLRDENGVEVCRVWRVA